MKLVIHDVMEEADKAWLAAIGRKQAEIVGEDSPIRHCVGCFGCWVRTPGTCVLKDGYKHLGERLAGCDEFVLVSRNVYGGYSPFVCNALNRTLSYVLPYFVTRGGETHHAPRYERRLKFTVHFYGEDMTEAERETARSLAEANATNFNARECEVFFHESLASLKEVWH